MKMLFISNLKGKPILPKALHRYAAMLSHGLCHVSTGGGETCGENIYSLGTNILLSKMLFPIFNMFVYEEKKICTCNN